MKRNSIIYHKTRNAEYRESQKTYAEKMKPDEHLAFKTAGYNVSVSKNDIHIDKNFGSYHSRETAYYELSPLIKRLEQMGLYQQAEILDDYVGKLFPAKELKMAISGVFTRPVWSD